MSHWEACLITVLRSVVLVALALPVCLWLRAFLRANRRMRGLAWLLLLVPVVLPRMVTGYGYANFSLSLVRYPVWNELFYDVLLLMTIVPVGTIMAYFAPHAPISAEAMHCLRLSPTHDIKLSRLVGFWMRGSWGQLVPAACLMFVIAFQEFELASLMLVPSWTVWIFDAQAGGLMLSRSLLYVVLPLAFELIVIAAAAVIAAKSSGLVAHPEEWRWALPTWARRAGWLYLAFALLLCCAVPWFLVLTAATAGLRQLTADFTIRGDIWAGCSFSFLAAVLAYLIAAATLFAGSLRKPARVLFTALVASPGLLGSLVLGLLVLTVFQSLILHGLYNTPLPWLGGLTLFLIPRAVVVLLLMTVTQSRESRHVIQLLESSKRSFQRDEARELRWRTSWSPHFGAFVLLFFWAYGDLTAAAILSPPGVVPAPVRLYNLMHYGQSAVLSAMVLATFGIPLLLFAMAVLCRRPLQRLLVA